jgi:outer membrane receptor protein involved in Fe transport
MVTPFASMSYVEGRDHRRGDRGVIPANDEEPLPNIAPFQTRVGVRYHEAAENPRWAIEFAARIVENQDRIASSLLERETPGFTTYNLRGYWQASEALWLTAGVENLTDKFYQEHLDLRTGRGVFQPGINFYFGFEWTY